MSENQELRLSEPMLGPQTKGSDEVIRRVEAGLEGLANAVKAAARLSQTHPFRISLIIPVFNERQSLPRVLDRIDEVMPAGTQTVIIDDASSDGTSEWLAEQDGRSDRIILRRKRNHGKGSAVRLGIRHSQGAVVAIQDADTEYDPADLLTVIDPIEQGRALVVFGSRYLSSQNDPSTLHRLGNWFLTATSNCMTGQRLTDMETCHKAFDGDLVRSIPIRECRFGFEPEITGKLSARGLEIREVPTGYRYRSYEEGKKITWRDGIAAFACMWRYRSGPWAWRAVRGLGRVLMRTPLLLTSLVVGRGDADSEMHR